MNQPNSQLYSQSIVIDGCSPLSSTNRGYTRYIEGGVTCVAATVQHCHGYLPEAANGITEWYDNFNRDKRLQLVLGYEDILEAKKNGKLGIILAFQGCTPLQARVSYVELYYRLGLRQMMLCYNTRNALGDGCEEPANSGLSSFGEKAIKEMNRLGILVDLTHTAERTTLEAMEVSTKPIIFTHSNTRGVYNSGRNLTDEQIIRAARSGGAVGLNGFPCFISKKSEPMLADLLDHLDYIVRLVGIDHVTLGIDYYSGQAGIASDEEAMEGYRKNLASNMWTEENYSPPPYNYPAEIRTPEHLSNIVPALAERGYADTDIKKILGENYLRIAKEVWHS